MKHMLALSAVAVAIGLGGCASTSDMRVLASRQAEDRARVDEALAGLRQANARLVLALQKLEEAGARDRRLIGDLREESRSNAGAAERRQETLTGSYNHLARAFNQREQFLSRLKVMTLPNGMTVLYVASE